MKMKKLLALLLTMVMITCLFIGCGQKKEVAETTPTKDAAPTKEAAETDEIFIGYVISDMSHEWYQNIKAGMEEYGAGLDNVKLQFVDSGYDQTALVNGAENLINSGVDVLVITPIDAAACVGVVEMAHEAGIPVICESNRIEGADTLVALANYDAGYAVGEFVANYVKENGLGKQFILAMGQEAYADCRDRMAGYKDAIADSGIEYEIVQEVDTDGTKEKSIELAGSVVIAHPEINCIFGINDNTATGAISAYKEAGYDMSKLTVVGLGMEGDVGREALLSGEYVGGMFCAPRYVGATIVKTALRMMNGETIEDHVKVKCVILTPDNFDKFCYQDDSGAWCENFEAIEALD
jgi:ribose transport system substrate-binding protein